MFDTLSSDRRRFLRTALGFSTGALLAGCGGGGTFASDPVSVVTAPATAAPTPTTPSNLAVAHPLNLALHLAYLGAQFYGIAARGSGLSPSQVAGTGTAGVASGARLATFGDARVASAAAELADDKQAHVSALRDRIGSQVAAQPALDLSVSARSAFSLAAQGAGIVAAGAPFDPYAGDDNFLLGAFLIENAVAAAYRTSLARGEDETTAVVTAQLGDAIYHGGLIRTMLDARADANPSIDKALTNATALFASLDGSNIGDQTLANARGESSNLIDAGGRAIPFTRANAQILKSLYLSSNAIGGFLPNGANGVTA